MFLRKNASSEMEAAFQETMAKNAVEEQTSGLTKVAEAMDLVANAAEIFDSVGMHTEAEYMTRVLESLASKKKKKKPAKKKDEEKEEKASASKKKRSDEATKDLTSDKMEDNLKHKCWVFNADDNAADDNFADYANKRREALDIAQKSPHYWNTKAREWYQKALDFQNKGGSVYQARECFKKADEHLAKAEELEAKLKGKSFHNDIDDSWAKDDEFYAKDERESDLARIMHEIEESSGPEPEFRSELEDDQDDDWDFPMQKSRSPRGF
jgi:hypothetical protein